MSDILDKLIPQYALNKTELDGYKKLCDKENAEIKSLMAKLDDNVYEVDGYRATYSVSERETMNEEVLLSLFSSVPSFVGVADKFEIVKSKPYIDFDALENAIYKEALTQDQLLEMNNKAREVKEVVTLRVTKIKEKK